MKLHYLIYLLLLILFTAACKKNDITNSGLSSTTGKGSGGKTTPTLPTAAPRLVDLKINGITCAFDSSSYSFYYPLSAGATLSTYTITFDTTATRNVLVNGVTTKNGATVNYELKTNSQVIIKAVNSLNITVTYSLVITGLPIVSLKTNGAAIGDNDINASFDLVNPDYQAQNSKQETSSNIMVSIRGATSRYYPKNSYAVHIVDQSGNDQDVSLLGLRNDNSWILDAMYIDQSRMRNRVCTDIWNSFNNVPYIAQEPNALNGTRGYMTEVFLNNRYHGVYCLTEKLDRKQLKINKQYGKMYKADLWTNETDFTTVSPFNNSSATWGGWELEYPDLGDTPAPDWSYLYNAVSFFATSADADFAAQIKNKVDLNNLADYFIFINIMAMPDNENKNTFFSFYDSRNSSNFFYSVWDMDGAIGRNASGGLLANQIIGANNNNVFQRLLKLNPENFKGIVKARWNGIKNNQLSKTTVAARIEAYRKLLVTTNAFARERLTWTNVNQDLDVEANYMNSWYATQYSMVDSYINGL